ncbi:MULTISPECIES: biliverdin-producing heme oxygenase [Streptomyces]|uniref:Heme oxygenase 1 n=1 Tax=Streptomyces rimosus subsp. rimosus TaxID=132474 RepID=A0ABY3Z7M8_STRRM|nr:MULTISPECIES: biliverdin-producing heme oxygenase [Streptomyces]KOG84218.1 heme oxygenase [Kitasatospora aureofaciens]KEF07599.1 heme oxygenase [Streptomyces rimosus]KEF20378.1 heme oxygenase [Streptomyces rimosus]KOT27900.1 heme oxygenase [Streptomyces sp. NRRL WC-3701]KOT42200.1 heme oxygenase [Streptomyces rimosus subsp. rimosus]
MAAPSSTPSAQSAAAVPFSTLIRTASHEQHTEAENSSFMGDLLGGKLGVAAYRRYTEQLWFVYRALEDAFEALADDPVAGPFIRPELARTAELERDLAHLGGPSWRTGLAPLPATAAYAERITECASRWPAGYVAHHYTRYLGDLSGGQIIRGTAEKTWGFARKGDGVRFYVFEGIGNPAAFKREYRELLDALPVDDLEKQRVVDECKRAFALNTAVFRGLGAEFPLSA